MKLIGLAVLALRLAAQPADSGAAKADELLKAARAALGAKLSTLHSLALWGADRRGAQGFEMAVTIDLSGKYLKEQSTLSTGGQVQRLGVGADGSTLSGGMPGDDGGPALSLSLVEGFDGHAYWTRNGAGAGKDAFVANSVRYVLALTLSPPNGFAVAFTHGGQLDSPHGAVDAIEGKGPDDFLIHLYLDADSHLPVTLVYHEGEQEIQLWLKDYKAEEGIRFPHTMAWLANGNLVEEFQIQHFKINPKLSSEKFRR